MDFQAPNLRFRIIVRVRSGCFPPMFRATPTNEFFGLLSLVKNPLITWTRISSSVVKLLLVPDILIGIGRGLGAHNAMLL